MDLKALAVPVILLLASEATRAGGGARVARATTLSISGDGSTARRSTLSSSGLLNGREGGLDSSGGRSSSLGSGGGGGGRDFLLSSSAQVLGTGVGLDVGGDLVDSEGCDIIALELGDECAGRTTGQLAGGRVDTVLDTSAAEGRRTGGAAVNNEGADLGTLVRDGLGDAREDVTLDKSLGAVVSVEGVALHILEIVVDGVEGTGGTVLAELGGTAGDIVEVVAVEGDLIACIVLAESLVVMVKDVRTYRLRRTSWSSSGCCCS